MKKAQVIVVVEGGLVQDIYGDAVEVSIIDLDCLKSGTEEEIQYVLGCLDEFSPATAMQAFPRAEIEGRLLTVLNACQDVTP